MLSCENATMQMPTPYFSLLDDAVDIEETNLLNQKIQIRIKTNEKNIDFLNS